MAFLRVLIKRSGDFFKVHSQTLNTRQLSQFADRPISSGCREHRIERQPDEDLFGVGVIAIGDDLRDDGARLIVQFHAQLVDGQPRDRQLVRGRAGLAAARVKGFSGHGVS